MKKDQGQAIKNQPTVWGAGIWHSGENDAHHPISECLGLQSTSTPDSRGLLIQTLGGSSAGSLVPATHMGDLDLAPRPQVFGE